MTVPLFRAGLARSACEVNCVVKQSAARTHRSELTGSIVRRRRNPLALARGGGQAKHIDAGWELLKHLPVEARKEVMKTFEENMLKNIQGDRFVIQQEMVHKPVKIERENEKGFDMSW